MHRVFSILFSWALAAIAWADVPADPRLKEILDLPDEQEFTGRFCKFLLEVPAPGFREFRNGLQQGMEEKSLSRRHAWRALGLADTRWVELDLPGYVSACKAGGMQIPADGKFHAVMRALETDPEAAMRWFVELGLDKNMGDAAAGFMARLAEMDPQRAVGFFMGLKEHSRFVAGAAAILRSWAKKDADAAWAGLKTWPQRAAEPGVYPPNPGETDNLRAVVCGEVARKDPARAERLFESIESLPERARARKRFLRNLGTTHPELALEFALKWNTPAAWEDFTLAASYGTAGETLRRLLEVLPKEHVERCLVKFFTTDEDPLLPVFQHAGLVTILPDKALRHAMILAMLGTEDRHRRPLPVALTEVVFDNGLELLAGGIPDNVRLRILAVMVGRDYQVVLPWLRQLREAQWKPFVDDVARSWPDGRLADDTRRLLVGESPLELELGKKLAERWWDKDPVGAFPQVIGKHGAQLVYDIDFEQFLRGCGGDVTRMQEMLSSIPDEPARRVALERLKLWSLGSEPAAAVLAEVLEVLKQPGNIRDTDSACGLVAYHEDPGMDALIAGIPDERVADRDKLLAMRASYLMGKGAQDRALPLWRQVRDDRVWMVSFERFTSTGDPRRIRNWESLVEMVTARPASKERTAAIKSISGMIARHAQKEGLEIAGKTTCDELRAFLLTELAERIQDPKLYETGMRLVNGLPENEANSTVRPAWRMATVRIDPAAAWAQAVGLGLETEEGGRIGRMAIERLAQDDAKAALALLIQTGKSALRTEFFRPVALALVSRDPAAAFKSARMMPPDVSREILSSAVSAWAKTAPEEACRASWGIEQARLRDACLQNALRIWLDADVDAAVAWIKALDDPGFRQAGMNAAMEFLAQKHPVKAAALCLEFRPERELAGIAGVIASALAESDYEEACHFLTKAAVGADVGKDAHELAGDSRSMV